MPIGVVSGFSRETKCLIADGVTDPGILSFSGVGPERSEYGSRELVNKGAEALVSFGIAGGLAPELQAGALVLASKVIDGEKTFDTSDEWRNSLKRALPVGFNIVEGPIVGCDTMVLSQFEKNKLHNNTGAVACDMETHALARVAVEKNLPFIVVRAISDPVWQDLPNWVLSCLTSKGEFDYFCIALALARRPWKLPNLISLASNSKRAFNSLHRTASVAGSTLGFSPSI